MHNHDVDVRWDGDRCHLKGPAVDHECVTIDAACRSELVHHTAGHATRQLLGSLTGQGEFGDRPSKPSARAMATSNAALEDKPAPIGNVVEMVPAMAISGLQDRDDAGDVAAPGRLDSGGIRHIQR